MAHSIHFIETISLSPYRIPYNSWITSAQHLMCVRTTADMQAHNSCCAVQGINNPEDRYYIFWQLLLYLPITSIILSCCYSYIFQSHLLYLSMIIDTSNYRPFWWYLWHQWHLWHLFSKTFFTRAGRKNFSEKFPARLRERVFKKTLSPVSSVIPK